MTLLPFLFLILLFVIAAFIGTVPVRKMIRVREAKHELKQGSAGFLRGVAGWGIIALWAMATWFFATILGDWQMSGDLFGALDRSQLRLRVLLEIAMSLSDN